MASRSQESKTHTVAIGALEHEGAFWGFTFSAPNTTLKFRYRNEHGASRARFLMFEALSETVWPDARLKGSAPAISPEIPDRSSNMVRLRQWTHDLLEEGQLDGFASKAIEAFLVFLIVANVVAVALESIPSMSDRFGGALSTFERMSLFVYSVEYVLRLWSCVEDPRIGTRGHFRGRLRFGLRPLMVVDCLAFAPGILGFFFGIDLRVLRIFRLFRLLKLARYSQALQALLNVLFVERSALLASAILLLAFTCLAGELMHLAEGAVQPKTLGTMPGAMYWALTTLTTVGYGDISPQTPLGKIIAGATMIAGLALFALPVGIIANGFVTGLSRRRFAITLSMLRKQPLLQGLDVDAVTEIMEIPTASIIREHAQLIVAGREAADFYLIVSGFARAEISNEDSALGPGDMVGAEVLTHLARYDQTVTAETEMRVLVFSGDEVRRLCRKFPLMRQRISAEQNCLDGEARRLSGDEYAGVLAEELARLQELVGKMALDKAKEA